MSYGETVSTAHPVPAHVPPDLVYPLNVQTDPGFRSRPHERMAEIAKKYRIFYTPYAAGMKAEGSWFVTRNEDIRAILQDPDTFRSGGARPQGEMLGDKWVLIPVDLDPPRHGAFRTIMNPLFSPTRMKVLEEKVIERAAEFVERQAGKTGCEFISEFARPYPVSIFLEMMGLPVEETATFVKWEEMIVNSPEVSRRLEGTRLLRDYLRDIIAERRKNPTDDLISFAVTSQVDGRPLTYDEIMGMCILLFMAGLDTVTSTLSFVFRYLGENPQEQAKLRADLRLLPDAIEELLRAFAVVTTRRTVARDTELCGTLVKAGETVVCPTAMASRDPEEFENPDQVILDRSPNRHSAFGFGPHRCIGSHLARRELVAGTGEWLKRLPPFRLADGAAARVVGSGVLGVEKLQLVWD